MNFFLPNLLFTPIGITCLNTPTFPLQFITNLRNKNKWCRQVAVQEEGRDSEEANRALVGEEGVEEDQQEGGDLSGAVRREELEEGRGEEDERVRQLVHGSPDSMIPE